MFVAVGALIFTGRGVGGEAPERAREAVVRVWLGLVGLYLAGQLRHKPGYRENPPAPMTAGRRPGVPEDAIAPARPLRATAPAVGRSPRIRAPVSGGDAEAGTPRIPPAGVCFHLRDQEREHDAEGPARSRKDRRVASFAWWRIPTRRDDSGGKRGLHPMVRARTRAHDGRAEPTGSAAKRKPPIQVHFHEDHRQP